MVHLYCNHNQHTLDISVLIITQQIPKNYTKLYEENFKCKKMSIRNNDKIKVMLVSLVNDEI